MSMILGGRIMNELVRALGQEQLKKEVPNFGPGDTVRVHVKIVEGREKEYKYSKVLFLRDKVEEYKKLSQLEKYLSTLV